MTKQETLAYYEAIGHTDELVCLDTTDTAQRVRYEIGKAADVGRENLSIEIFHEGQDIISLAMFISGGTVDMYRDKQCVLFGSTMEEAASYVMSCMPKALTSPYTHYVSGMSREGRPIIKPFKKGETWAIDPNGNDEPGEFILGKYTNSQGDTAYHPVKMPENIEIKHALEPYVNRIVDNRLRLFARVCLDIIPEYVAYVPAGSNSEKRPPSNIAKGGLLRHLAETCEILLLLTGREYAHVEYTQHEIDMMLVAAMFHDFLHRGWQEEFDEDPSVKPDHPLKAAKALRCVTGIIPSNDMTFITNCIEAHMGVETGLPTGEFLPIPDTRYKYLVHLANFLATRGNLRILHRPDIDEFVYEHRGITTVDPEGSLSDDAIATIVKASRTVRDKKLRSGLKEIALPNGADWDLILGEWDCMLRSCMCEKTQSNALVLAYSVTKN